MTRPISLILTALTGFSGLVYEVTWQKYLATLLGSHSEATAAVLGIYLGGLALGYSTFGVVTRRRAVQARAGGRPVRLLRMYGWIEAGIGLHALGFPLLFQGIQRISYAIPHESLGAGFAIDVTLAALLILPPTLLMGATIPILTQGLARDLDDSTRVHAYVYAFNTLGAFAGALAAGFYLVPRLGLVDVMRWMGAINLLAGAIFMLLGSRRQQVIALAAGEGAPPPIRGFGLYAVVALLLGFAMMALQATLIRVAGLAFGSSQYTFAMVVAVFVLCIALGSFAVSLPRSIPRLALAVSLWGLAGSLYLLYGLLPEAPYWVHVLRTRFGSQPADFDRFWLSGFLGVLLLISPSVLLSGASLPLLFHQLRRQVADLGAVAGRIYGWNTFGSFCGALLGGYLLLFWLDLHHVYRIAVAAVGLAACLATLRAAPSSRVTTLGMLLLLLFGLVVLREPWPASEITAGLFREREVRPWSHLGSRESAQQRWVDTRLVFYDDDPTSTITVLERMLPRGRSLSIVTNGKSDGNTIADYTTMALLAGLPAIFAETPERAFVVGYGTGVTTGELAALDAMAEVVVAEISPAVVSAAPHFDFANLAASKSEKVEIERSDAYRALLRSRGDFDVIVSEPSNPWVTGVEMLYSREFLEAARDRLAPGGVFAQWFHQYSTDPETLGLVLRTFSQVFGESSLWYARYPDVILLGFEDRAAALDLDRVIRRAAAPDYSALLNRAGIHSVAELLAHEYLPLGVMQAAGLQGDIHTLLNPRLGHAAGRAFFAGGMPPLPFTGFGAPARLGRQHSLLRRLARKRGGRLPDEVRAGLVRRICPQVVHQCAMQLAAWRGDARGSAGFTRSLDSVQQIAGGLTGLDAEAFSDRRIETLAGMLPAGRTGSGPVPLPVAEGASRLYREFYQHSTPFDPERLLDLWRRCDPGNAPAARSTTQDSVLGRATTQISREAGSTASCRQGLKAARRLVRKGR